MLDPGAGKTHKASVWAYARGAFDSTPAVVFDFSTGRAGRHPLWDELRAWLRAERARVPDGGGIAAAAAIWRASVRRW